MGFTCRAKKKDERGEPLLFEESAWSWRPLWRMAFVLGGGSLPEPIYESGRYNSGAKVPEATAAALARAIRAHGTEKIRAIIAALDADLDALPLVDCRICGGTGGRKKPAQVGPGPYPCNGCGGGSPFALSDRRGTGKVKDERTHYRVDLDHFVEFVGFLESSGGFEIW